MVIFFAPFAVLGVRCTKDGFLFCLKVSFLGPRFCIRKKATEDTVHNANLIKSNERSIIINAQRTSQVIPLQGGTYRLLCPA